MAPAATVPPPQAYAPAKKGSGLSLLLIIVGVLGLIAVIGIGGVVYVGYQVKQKVTSVAQQVTHPAPSPVENKDVSPAKNDNNDVGALLGNLGNMLGGGTDDGDPVESISDKDPVTPCPAAPFPAQNTARIPLLAGTVVTHCMGDEER